MPDSRSSRGSYALDGETADLMPIDPETREILKTVVECSFHGDEQLPERLARKNVDWNSLIACAREHRVAPLLYARLVEADAPIPPEIRELLRIDFDRNAFRSLANATELVSILKRFDEQSILAMPFKGVVLATSVYKSLTIRPAGDLDLLIFERDLRRATEVLLESGYQLRTEAHEDGSPALENYYEYHFERPSDGMVLELRWRLELTQPRYRHNLGMEWVWPQRQTMNLAGVDVPNLDPERSLLMLCMHGSKHAWSRLIWICDVAQLLKEKPNLDWNAVTREARRVGLLRALAFGVMLAQRVCGAPVPAKVLRRFESNRDAHDLAAYFAESVFEEPGKVPAGHLPYSVRLLDFRDRLRMLSTNFARPNVRDQQILHLPKGLHFLYYLVRPIRILFHRSAR
jgi:putative nucleotidyltransferase-like protein